MGKFFSKSKGPREDFEDFIEEPWKLQVNRRPVNNQIYKKTTNSGSTCDSGSCKNLIYNEIKKKHNVRLKNNMEKISYLKSRRKYLINQINILNNKLSELKKVEYFNNMNSSAKINNMLNKLKNELNKINNELAYIYSYEIEFMQLHNEMIN